VPDTVKKGRSYYLI